VAITDDLIRYTIDMRRNLALAIMNWKPAPEGSGWDRINTAWLILFAMVEVAENEDKKALD